MNATLRTKVNRRRLKELKLLGGESAHENARYMNGAQFNRLVENIRRDGVLTSAPLVAQIQDEGEDFYVASGNHRILAAIKAGIDETEVIEIIGALEKTRFVSIQLAHNAIEGEDNPAVLRRLYESLDLDLKEYSGLNESSFDIDSLGIKTISGLSPLYCDVVISFLAEDAQALDDFLKSNELWARKNKPQYAAQYEDFNKFFDTIVRAKKLLNVTNTAVAISCVLDLARERIGQLEADAADVEQNEEAA